MSNDNFLNMYFKSKDGKILKLLKLRESNVNTYVHCNEKGEPIIAKREWLLGKQESEQLHIISGFDKLTEIDLNQLYLFK